MEADAHPDEPDDLPAWPGEPGELTGLYRDFFHRSRDGFVIVDPAGRIREANQAFCDMLGYSLAELQEKEHFREITPPRWHEWEQAEIWQNRCLKKGYSGIYEKEYIHSDGHVFPVELQAYAVFDESGRAIYIWGVARDISARQENEQTLDFQAAVLRQIQDIVTVTDLDGRITYMNDAALRMLNRPADQIIGQHISSLGQDPSRGASQQEIIEQTLAKGSWRGEVVNLTATGEKVILDCRTRVLTDSQGQPTGLCGISTDITQEVRAEEHRRLMQFSVDHAAVGIFRIDENGLIDYVNEAACVSLGYDRDELIGMSVSQIDPTYPAGQREAFRAMLKKTGSKTVQTSQRRKDGTFVEVEVTDHYLEFDGRGYEFAFATDISARRRAEETLHTRLDYEQALRNVSRVLLGTDDPKAAIREGMQSLLEVTDAQRVYIFHNSTEGELGLCMSQAYEVCGPGVPPEIDNPDLQKLPYSEGFERWATELQANRPISGNICDFPPAERAILEPQGIASMLVLPVWVHGQWYGFIGFDRTIEEKEWAIEDVHLLHTAAEMIGTFIERQQAIEDRALLEEQLRQAQKMQAVGRLAGGVAHDFNNKLQAILGYADILLDKLDPHNEPFEFVETIRDAAEQSAALTRQLLAFARKQTIAPRVIDLNHCIDGMLAMLKRLLGEDIDLLWRPAEELWPVKLDPVQVDQILANLLVNARDAVGSAGKITIETSCVTFDRIYCQTHPEMQPGEYVLLAVSDNGKGIDAETLPQIFEPFFTTKPTHEGTGLGLAMVYGIVRQNNGFIHAYSEPDQGTTFKIYLPREQGDSADDAERPDLDDQLAGDETVLLVEDDAAILKLVQRILGRFGYHVLSACDPVTALETAAHFDEPIDLLLTDVVMPVMSGRELYQQLLAQRGDLKCLFMSGYTANVIAHHGILDDGVHFIEKPFDPGKLGQMVRAILDG
jgi:PAS domain S-box-containing protein